MTAQVSDVTSPLQVKVNRMARQVSAVAVALAAVVFALRSATTSRPAGGQLRVRPRGHGGARARGAFPATLSVSLAIGVRRMAAATP